MELRSEGNLLHRPCCNCSLAFVRAALQFLRFLRAILRVEHDRHLRTHGRLSWRIGCAKVRHAFTRQFIHFSAQPAAWPTSNRGSSRLTTSCTFAHMARAAASALAARNAFRATRGSTLAVYKIGDAYAKFACRPSSHHARRSSKRNSYARAYPQSVYFAKSTRRAGRRPDGGSAATAGANQGRATHAGNVRHAGGREGFPR